MDVAEILATFVRILPQTLVSGVALGSVYALIAQGYYVTFTTTETVNFSQGEFLMIGALTSFSLMVLVGVHFLVALVAVVLLMAVMGIVVERVAIRPLRQLTSVGWVLSTVGVSVILRQWAEIYWGREQKRVPSMFGETPIFLGGTGIFPQEIFIIVASLLTMAILLLFLKRSTFGKALQAVAFNPAAAGLMGINVRQMIVVAYVISSILASVAGVLVAPVIFAHAEMGALLGLIHVPEGRQVFANQSVRDNLLLGAFQHVSDRVGTARLLERELQRFPVLRERQHQLAGTLSGGEQQMLAISRGLMGRPKLLLLDEPSMGLAPLLVRQVADSIQHLNTEGVTILLVEQMAAMALSVANRAYVIQNGVVRVEGPSASLVRNPEVVRAYLGGAAQHEVPRH